ncbi:unnamed protein product [Urochloa decumbens]|uniref:RING-type E3 ubiquitin transferase n=1 Tax=Urochloa decumbens TaxID=240449 RepID=A0ABC8Z092_9POAL
MDAAAAMPMPTNKYITAETTRLNLVPLRDDEPSKLVLDLAVTETHEWFGIGGRRGRLRRPRRLSRNMRLPLAAASAGGDPDYLRSAGDCRRLISQTITHLLGEEEAFRWLTAAHWDAAVPRGVEYGIAARAGSVVPGGGPCACEVSIRVRAEFVYSEAEELLSACAEAADMQVWRSASGGGGAAPPCSVCLEEMAPEAELRLPGCAHGFHRECIGRWFEKASTCPVCRHDKLGFLPPDYMAVHDMMLSDPEGSC